MNTTKEIEKLKELIEKRISLYFITHEDAFIRHNPDSKPFPSVQYSDETLGDLSDKLSTLIDLRIQSLLEQSKRESVEGNKNYILGNVDRELHQYLCSLSQSDLDLMDGRCLYVILRENILKEKLGYTDNDK